MSIKKQLFLIMVCSNFGLSVLFAPPKRPKALSKAFAAAYAERKARGASPQVSSPTLHSQNSKIISLQTPTHRWLKDSKPFCYDADQPHR